VGLNVVRRRAMAELPSGTVTFLFTDIAGSTRLWEQHPQAMSSALARHDAILREAIEEQGGAIFHTAGDAFCAAFASPPGAPARRAGAGGGALARAGRATGADGAAPRQGRTARPGLLRTAAQPRRPPARRRPRWAGATLGRDPGADPRPPAARRRAARHGR